ncbi:MAG: hypothetical protein N3H30_03000 [Candidatus Micrarchaeota archaeon]|nr:hypothetical protein [Candidatus Micrarchaeota archaeon]
MFSRVKNKPLYSQMKHLNIDERSKAFATMLKENPRHISYFTKKKWYRRLPELAWLLISNDAYYRKEHMRAGLYALAEPHLGKGKNRDPSIETEVKSALADSHIHLDPSLKQDAKPLETISDAVRKPLDVSKILRDKEWYRWLLRTAAAAAAAIALWTTGYSGKKDEPLVVEVEKEVPADCSEFEGALNECLDALKRKPSCPNIGVVYKYVDKEVKIPDQSALNELKARLAEVEPLREDAEQWKNFKLNLMDKVDRVFFTVTTKEDKNYYTETIRPWFEMGVESGDRNMIKLIIFMGGELLRQERDEKGCIANVGAFKNTKEFGDYWEDGKVTYPGGYAGAFNSWNLRCNNARAVWDYYTSVYNSIAKSAREQPPAPKKYSPEEF